MLRHSSSTGLADWCIMTHLNGSSRLRIPYLEQWCSSVGSGLGQRKACPTRRIEATQNIPKESGHQNLTDRRCPRWSGYLCIPKRQRYRKTDHPVSRSVHRTVFFICASESIYENSAFRFSGQSGQKKSWLGAVN